MDAIWPSVVMIAVAPFIGSFLAVAAGRWGSAESALLGRSRCNSCRHVLSPFELVPLVSYAALGGRCHACSARISPLHPGMEIGALALAGLSALFVPPHLVWISAALGWVLLLLAAIDLRSFLLPDLLTLPLIVAGLLFSLTEGEAAWMSHAAGAGIGWLGAAGLAWLYEKAAGRAGLGGGDVKLFAAAGAWLGAGGLPLVMLASAGTALALVALAKGAGFTVKRTTRIPFGPFLALGFYAVWLAGAGRF